MIVSEIFTSKISEQQSKAKQYETIQSGKKEEKLLTRF